MSVKKQKVAWHWKRTQQNIGCGGNLKAANFRAAKREA
jgi:hypothetical protein